MGRCLKLVYISKIDKKICSPTTNTLLKFPQLLQLSDLLHTDVGHPFINIYLYFCSFIFRPIYFAAYFIFKKF